MRSLLRSSLAAGVVLAAAVAHSMELFDVVSLPGNGGRPIGSFMDYTDDSCMIVGVYNGTVGQVAVVWDLDNDGLLQGMSTLPKPAGSTSEAVGGAMYPNGDIAIVGNVFVGGNPQNPRAAIWRKAPLGTYQLTILTNGISRVSQSEYGGAANPHLRVVGGLVQGGVLRPFLADVMVSSLTAQLLPYIEQDALALGIDFNRDGDVSVFGWVTGRNGLRKPAGWFGPEFDMARTIPVYNNASAEAQDGDTDGADLLAWGSLTRNGRTLAGLYSNNPGGGLLGVLSPLSGFANSSVAGPLMLGDTGTHEVGHWMGMSSRTNGSEPTVWTDMRPLSFQQALLEPLSYKMTDVMISSYRDHSNAGMGIPMFGQRVNETVTNAVALLPSEVVVADRFNVMEGAIIGDAWHVGDLWHEDGNELSFKTEKVGSERMAEIELSLGRTMGYSPSTSPTPGTFTVAARAQGNHPNAGGTLMIHLFNFETQSYMELESVSLGITSQRFDVAIPDVRPFINPATGETKACLEFVQNGNKPTAFSLNYTKI